MTAQTKGVDVQNVLDSIWHEGLTSNNVFQFEEARAAIAELLDAATSMLAATEGADVVAGDVELSQAAWDLQHALAKCVGPQ